MRFRFTDKKLEALYTDEQGANKYEVGVVDAFFEAMAVIEAAKDVRDIRNIKSFRFEKLKHDRKGQHSLRLNRQWRLIVEIEQDAAGTLLAIIEIADYH